MINKMQEETKRKLKLIKLKLRIGWEQGLVDCTYGCWSSTDEELLGNYEWILSTKLGTITVDSYDTFHKETSSMDVRTKYLGELVAINKKIILSGPSQYGNYVIDLDEKVKTEVDNLDSLEDKKKQKGTLESGRINIDYEDDKFIGVRGQQNNQDRIDFEAFTFFAILVIVILLLVMLLK